MSVTRIKNMGARLSASILASSVMGLIPLSVAAQTSNEELQLRIEELQAQISALAERASAAEQRQAEIDNPEPAAKPGATQIEIGGFIKLDSQFSDYSDGSSATSGIGEDFLVPSTIPVGGEEGDTKFHSHAKSSRLFIKSHTALAHGQVNTHLEIDAIGSSQGDERVSNSYSQRLRHAYVDWQIDDSRGLLAGQTWSTFFNVGTLPEGMDFVGPVGAIFERQPQLRYTQKIGGGSIQFAVENPATTLYNGTENPYDDSTSPDIILRYNNSVGDFSYSIASMSRELAYEDGDNSDSIRGNAISVSGKYQLGRDDIRFMLSSGNALGRYMGLNSYRAGIIEADGEIELIEQAGGFIALRHFWNDEWRSNLVLSASEADNPETVSDTTASAYKSLHLNLLYSPVPKMTLGLEYILASKEVENVSGTLLDDEGELQRLQFSVKYGF